MADEIIIETTSAEVIEVGVPGPQGPAGAAGTGLETLTTKGDTLYRGETTGERLPIGTTGQILRVSAGGVPEWGTESGAVASVNNQTGAVYLDGSDIDTSASDDRMAFVASGFDDDSANGLYYPLDDLTINSKRIYKSTNGYHAFFENSRWHLTDGTPITENIVASSNNNNAAWPWKTTWPGTVTEATVADVVGRARSTFLFQGDLFPKTMISGLGTAAEEDAGAFAAASHSHELDSLDATGGGVGDILIADGDGGVSWESFFPASQISGLGNSSTKNVGAGANDVAAGNDARFSDARQPLSHASTHHTGGADAIAPSSIGAQSLFATTTNTITGNTTITAGRALIYQVAVTSGSPVTADINLPSSGHQSGDVVVVRSITPFTSGSVLTIKSGTGATLNTITASNQAFRYTAADGSPNAWSQVLVDTHTHTFGTTAGTFTEGNDARLSDSRTPTSHAASHAAAGSDPVTLDVSQVASVNGFGNVWGGGETLADVFSNAGNAFFSDQSDFAAASHTHAASDISSGTLDIARIPTGTGSTQVALGNHTHELTALAATGAANGTILTANGSGGVTFAAASGGGVTGAAASASDVLGVSGANITGVDANADRIVFWDDSASALKHLTVGSGLSLTDTTLTATATGTIGGSTSTDNAIVRADSTSNTVQDSAFIIADNATASPNNTVNHASIQATGGTTNVSVSIVPKGTGAFMLRVPDSASTGGNSRGVNAVDLMLERAAANQVASGEASFAAGSRHVVSGTRAAAVGGYGSTASASNAVTLGALNTATGETSGSLCGYSNDATASEAVVVGGNSNDATAARSSVIGGNNNIASADSSICVGGQRATANRFCIHAHAAGQFAAGGDAQRIRAVLRCKTTTNAAVEMALDGSTTYLTIPSGKVIYAEIRVVGTKSDGSAVACFTRQYAAKNVAGTSSEVFAPVTIGTDTAAGTSLEVATVDAGDYIRIRPTGIASETWRWVASVDAVEVAYGT